MNERAPHEWTTAAVYWKRGRAANERYEAIDFLKEILLNGAVPTKEIFAQAAAQGYSERTLRRARKALGVLSFHNSSGSWAWHLPDDPDMVSPPNPTDPVPDPRKPVVS